ncbi:MAG TPA: hypothetical protein VNA25_02780 [Phycisphaerae bacterium]|nr:hypothetical protein [Phycisphaerae bacterium]
MPEETSMPLEEEPISLPGDQDDEPLSLVGDGETTGRKVRAIGGDHGLAARTESYKRPLNVTGQGAIRCKLFHSKIAPPSLEYMQDQINQWLDSEEAEVKMASQVIGIMEGKTPVPNLIVTIWY